MSMPAATMQDILEEEVYINSLWLLVKKGKKMWIVVQEMSMAACTATMQDILNNQRFSDFT